MYTYTQKSSPGKDNILSGYYIARPNSGYKYSHAQVHLKKNYNSDIWPVQDFRKNLILELLQASSKSASYGKIERARRQGCQILRTQLCMREATAVHVHLAMQVCMDLKLSISAAVAKSRYLSIPSTKKR